MSKNNNNSNDQNTNSSNEWLDYIIENGVPNARVAKFWQDVINKSLSHKAITTILEWIKTKYYSDSIDDRAINSQQIIAIIADEISNSKLPEEEIDFIVKNLSFYFSQQEVNYSTELKNFCEQIYLNFSKDIFENVNLIQGIKQDLDILNTNWENKNFEEEFSQKLTNLGKIILDRGIVATDDTLIQGLRVMHKFFENPTNFSLQDIQDSDISGAEQDLKISKIIKDIKQEDYQQEYNENSGQFIYAELDDLNSQLAIDFVFENRSFNVSTSFKAIDIAKNIYIQNINNPQINQIIYNIAENINKLADSEKHVKSFIVTVLVSSNNNAVLNLDESKETNKVDNSDKEAEEIENDKLSQAIAMSLESCVNETEEKSDHFNKTDKESSSGISDNSEEKSNSLKRKREKEDTEENNKELAKKQKIENIDKNLKTLINAFEEKINVSDFQESKLLLETLEKIISSKDQIVLTKLYVKMQDILASENIMLPDEICKQFIEGHLVGWYNNRHLVEENYQVISSEYQDNAVQFEMQCNGDGGLSEEMNQ